MSKMSKAIAVLGVVAGLGVAAMPLGAYAALPTEGYQTSTSAPVQVEVEGAISIASNIDTIGQEGVINLGKIMPGTVTEDMTNPLEITVSSNSNGANYDLYMYATNKNNVDTDNAMIGLNTGTSIAAGTAASGTESWGYEMGTGDDKNTFAGTYAAVPTKANATVVAADQSTAGATEGVKATSVNKFKFAAATKATTVADTYQATVVFTAVAK